MLAPNTRPIIKPNQNNFITTLNNFKDKKEGRDFSLSYYILYIHFSKPLDSLTFLYPYIPLSIFKCYPCFLPLFCKKRLILNSFKFFFFTFKLLLILFWKYARYIGFLLLTHKTIDI